MVSTLTRCGHSRRALIVSTVLGAPAQATRPPKEHAGGFEVLAVNYQEGAARIKSFIDKMNFTLPVVRDTDGGVARAWGARVFPANYLIDRAGNIRYWMSGAADWTSPALVSTIRALLTSTAQRSR